MAVKAQSKLPLSTVLMMKATLLYQLAGTHHISNIHRRGPDVKLFER